MYLILAKDDHRIIFVSPTLNYQENGNYLINNDSLAIPPSICDMQEVSSVPDFVEPEKWSYIDGEFVPNPNYHEPIVPVSEEDMQHFIDIIEGRVDE